MKHRKGVKYKYAVKVTRSDDSSIEFTKETGWGFDRLRTHVISVYPTCKYVYIKLI